MHDRYGHDVLRRPRSGREIPTVPVTANLVVECASSGYCGAVVGTEKTSEGWVVTLEDRRGLVRAFPLEPGAFLLDGEVVTLALPSGPVLGRRRSASGSTFVADAPTQVAKASRIWVEGIHDADLIEAVWGHDLRVEGVVVEPLHGADDLLAALTEFDPQPDRRIGVLLDHLVPGSKESRIAHAARENFDPHVRVVGHPFVDIWQAVKPARIGLSAWPDVPLGRPWKAGVLAALGWSVDEATAWAKIRGRVRGYTDLEPALLAAVEELIDFVTIPPG